MAEEFEGDLQHAVFWGADLTGARFRDVNLTGTRISHAWLVDVEVDALVERVVINGVDITAYVNEHDDWYPLRAMLRPSEPADMRATWTALAAAWAPSISEVQALPAATAHESVNGEWSFVQTIQHLVMAMDKWFTAPVLGEPFSPIGLPNTGSRDFPFPGVDLASSPSFDQALAARADRSARFASYLDTVTPGDLERVVDVLENGPHPMRECIFTVFEEEFWHLRYATRDLVALRASRVT